MILLVLNYSQEFRDLLVLNKYIYYLYIIQAPYVTGILLNFENYAINE